MLAVAEDAMQVTQIITGAIVSVAQVLDEEPCPFAVLLSFVVLLAVLDESSLAVIGGAVTRLFDAFLDPWLLSGRAVLLT